MAIYKVYKVCDNYEFFVYEFDTEQAENTKCAKNKKIVFQKNM